MINVTLRFQVHNGSEETKDYQTPERVRELLQAWVKANIDACPIEVIDEAAGIADALTFTEDFSLTFNEER